MNLTKCLLAGLCISAMTASVVEALPRVNAFETLTDQQQLGWFVGVDKSLESDGIVVTGDASDTSYALARPMTGVTSNKVLKLETNGGTWTNEVTGGSFALVPVYVDMLVKFVPSEELTPVANDVKMAIAVTNGNLVVTKNNGSDVNEWVATSTAINTSLWYRVTVELSFETPSVKATVKINGTEVTVDGFPSFIITDNAGGDQTLRALGFSGTGFIDEVVVTDVNPFGSTTVAFGGIGPQVEQQELQMWKDANEITGTEDPNSFDAFVMNVAPEEDGTSPVLFVDSIAVDGDVSVTVQAKYADGTLGPLGDPLNYGAVITVWGKVNLSDGDWVNLGDLLTFDPGTCQFFAVTVGEADVPPGGVSL